MGRYVKKPVTVDAFRLGYDGTPDWALDAVENMALILHGTQYGIQEYTDISADVKTLDGWVCAKYGDYIIRGVKGEIYPCKPDIFEKTYESDCGSDLHLKAGEVAGDKPRFKPGDAVWIVLRGERGNAVDVIACMFLAESEGVVIADDNIYLDRLNVVIKKLVQRTKQRLRTGLCVYPAADCYATREEAWWAVDKEDEGE